MRLTALGSSRRPLERVQLSFLQERTRASPLAPAAVFPAACLFRKRLPISPPSARPISLPEHVSKAPPRLPTRSPTVRLRPRCPRLPTAAQSLATHVPGTAARSKLPTRSRGATPP